jgi:enoyl-CoA hydratase
MPEPCVTLRIDNRVGWLELDRPPRNTFDWAMYEAMDAGLRRLLGDPQVAVVVFASALDGWYSVGGDLRFFQNLSSDGLRQYLLAWRQLAVLMRDSAKPLLAAIHGTAVGGGVELALLCDVRFATADARLGLPEIHIGYVPQIGATRNLTRMLGRSRALRFLYEGALISAPDAAELGLVDVVVEPGRLREAVQGYASDLACKPKHAIAALRRCVSQGLELGDDDFFQVELQEALGLWGTSDLREGIRAFIEKRPPDWETAMGDQKGGASEG